MQSPIDTDRRAARRQRIALGVLALVITAAAVWTLRTYLSALAWAGVFAIATWPLFLRLGGRWPGSAGRSLLALLFTAGVALLFVVPLGLLGIEVAREARAVLGWLEEAERSGVPAPAWLGHLPYGAAQIAQWWQDNLGSPAGASRLAGHLAGSRVVAYGRNVGLFAAHRLLLFGFMLLTLFFLFRDGTALTAQMRRAGERLFGPSGERIGSQIVASVHGTLDGLVLVGLGEGVLIGIGYAVAGVPRPFLFGAVTAVAAMLPFCAPVVFGIAAVLLLVQGATLAAGGLFGFGVLVTFVADHFVRPVLIGGAVRLPFLLVLLGILGGVETWGLLGLFLGPAIMAAAALLWREFTAAPPAEAEAEAKAAPRDTAAAAALGVATGPQQQECG